MNIEQLRSESHPIDISIAISTGIELPITLVEIVIIVSTDRSYNDDFEILFWQKSKVDLWHLVEHLSHCFLTYYTSVYDTLSSMITHTSPMCVACYPNYSAPGCIDDRHLFYCADC